MWESFGRFRVNEITICAAPPLFSLEDKNLLKSYVSIYIQRVLLVVFSAGTIPGRRHKKYFFMCLDVKFK